MDDLGNLLLQKGMSYVLNLVLGTLVIYFIKKERQDRKEEFEGYKLTIINLQKNITSAGTVTKEVLDQAVGSIKTEFHLFKMQTEELKKQVIKETFNLSVQSKQIHERSENIKKSFDEVVGRVILVEKNQVGLHKVLEYLVKKGKQ